MDQIPPEEIQRTGTEAWPELGGAPGERQSRGKAVCEKERGQQNAQNYKTGGIKERKVTEQTKEIPQTEKETEDLQKV